MKKTYKNHTASEIINLLAIARSKQCQQQNLKKFGNTDYNRVNENVDVWKKHYCRYPLFSKKFPTLSLSYEYDRFYENK